MKNTCSGMLALLLLFTILRAPADAKPSADQTVYRINVINNDDQPVAVSQTSNIVFLGRKILLSSVGFSGDRVAGKVHAKVSQKCAVPPHGRRMIEFISNDDALETIEQVIYELHIEGRRNITMKGYCPIDRRECDVTVAATNFAPDADNSQRVAGNMNIVVYRLVINNSTMSPVTVRKSSKLNIHRKVIHGELGNKVELIETTVGATSGEFGHTFHAQLLADMTIQPKAQGTLEFKFDRIPDSVTGVTYELDVTTVGAGTKIPGTADYTAQTKTIMINRDTFPSSSAGPDGKPISNSSMMVLYRIKVTNRILAPLTIEKRSQVSFKQNSFEAGDAPDGYSAAEWFCYVINEIHEGVDKRFRRANPQNDVIIVPNGQASVEFLAKRPMGDVQSAKYRLHLKVGDKALKVEGELNAGAGAMDFVATPENTGLAPASTNASETSILTAPTLVEITILNSANVTIKVAGILIDPDHNGRGLSHTTQPVSVNPRGQANVRFSVPAIFPVPENAKYIFTSVPPTPPFTVTGQLDREGRRVEITNDTLNPRRPEEVKHVSTGTAPVVEPPPPMQTGATSVSIVVENTLDNPLDLNGEIRNPDSGAVLTRRISQTILGRQRATFAFHALRPEGIPDSSEWAFTSRYGSRTVSATGRLDRDGRQVRIGMTNLR